MDNITGNLQKSTKTDQYAFFTTYGQKVSPTASISGHPSILHPVFLSPFLLPSILLPCLHVHRNAWCLSPNPLILSGSYPSGSINNGSVFMKPFLSFPQFCSPSMSFIIAPSTLPPAAHCPTLPPNNGHLMVLVTLHHGSQLPIPCNNGPK